MLNTLLLEREKERERRRKPNFTGGDFIFYVDDCFSERLQRERSFYRRVKSELSERSCARSSRLKRADITRVTLNKWAVPLNISSCKYSRALATIKIHLRDTRYSSIDAIINIYGWYLNSWLCVYYYYYYLFCIIFYVLENCYSPFSTLNCNLQSHNSAFFERHYCLNE